MVIQVGTLSSLTALRSNIALFIRHFAVFIVYVSTVMLLHAVSKHLCLPKLLGPGIRFCACSLRRVHNGRSTLLLLPTVTPAVHARLDVASSCIYPALPRLVQRRIFMCVPVPRVCIYMAPSNI